MRFSPHWMFLELLDLCFNPPLLQMVAEWLNNPLKQCVCHSDCGSERCWGAKSSFSALLLCDREQLREWKKPASLYLCLTAAFCTILRWSLLRSCRVGFVVVLFSCISRVPFLRLLLALPPSEGVKAECKGWKNSAFVNRKIFSAQEWEENWPQECLVIRQWHSPWQAWGAAVGAELSDSHPQQRQQQPCARKERGVPKPI